MQSNWDYDFDSYIPRFGWRREMLTAVPDLETVRYAREVFPTQNSDFNALFYEHAMEVAKRPFQLDWQRYYQMEFQKRLVWMVARYIETSKPIGYSCHYWMRDMHFDERVAIDGLWFVTRAMRRKGIGGTLKKLGHRELIESGVLRTGDTIRAAFDHPNLMASIGFEKWGTRWVKKF